MTLSGREQTGPFDLAYWKQDGVVTSSELERRLADLERRIPQGMMVSTTYGRAEVRPFQVGFPAVLTSAFDPISGYSWQQQVLDLTLPGIDATELPRAGNNAFTPDNNQSLQAGQHGWLESIPRHKAGSSSQRQPFPVAPARVQVRE